MNPAYEPRGRNRLYDTQGRERQRVKRCPEDRAVLTEDDGVLRCVQCDWTAEREQVSL